MEPPLKRLAPRTNWGSIESFLAPTGFRSGSISCGNRVDRTLRTGATVFGASCIAAVFSGPRMAVRAHRGSAYWTRRYCFAIKAPVILLFGAPARVARYENHDLAMMIAARLSSWGYNTSTIVAGLGVGGIAIALAAQKTVENFFGGVAVVSDRPVAVGDFCKFLIELWLGSSGIKSMVPVTFLK
jgi:hypothetical protein